MRGGEYKFIVNESKSNKVEKVKSLMNNETLINELFKWLSRNEYELNGFIAHLSNTYELDV